MKTHGYTFDKIKRADYTMKAINSKGENDLFQSKMDRNAGDT